MMGAGNGAGSHHLRYFGIGEGASFGVGAIPVGGPVKTDGWPSGYDGGAKLVGA